MVGLVARPAGRFRPHAHPRTVRVLPAADLPRLRHGVVDRTGLEPGLAVAGGGLVGLLLRRPTLEGSALGSLARGRVRGLPCVRSVPVAEVSPLKIVAVRSAFPTHWYDQRTLTDTIVRLVGADARLAERIRSLHANTGIDGRFLVLPLERYAELGDFTAANAAWVEGALQLGEAAVGRALAAAGVTARDVDAIFFSTVTGLASPSIDARLVTRLGFRTDVKRMPLFGLGCVAGAAAVSRAVDYLRGHPRGVAVVLTVELCSLTLQPQDRSVANLISMGVFGDGAAAAVLVGAEHPLAGVAVEATRSVFYPETEHVMGWDIGAHGFRIVLSAEVPAVARERVPVDVDAFLADHGRRRADVRHWVAHPGGPKVLQGLQDGLGLRHEDLRCSWECLARAGNLSSASVLMILERTLQSRGALPGDLGVLLAMGPGFCSEYLMLRW
ncbi:MAG: type III polyketide synthase [Planctomycetes bacterium]|nr:type III polyketide synthase [Planctomycetota bacterium]